MDQCTRRIVGFGVQAGVVDGPAVRRMLNTATHDARPPRYFSSDHDPLFEFRRLKANLRILGISEVKTVPYLPLSHPFVERLIGTIRREFLDQVPFWTAQDLEKGVAPDNLWWSSIEGREAGCSPAPGGMRRTREG